MIDDTIAAISTSLGMAGIGIVRVSGNEAIEIVQKVFNSKTKRFLKDVRNHSLVYGHIVDSKGKIIDEVLVSVMKGPHSFTAEDVVEINCHGGIVAVKKTLEAVLKEGARIAEPGEFSKRAFLNGRIDLAQAESIIDLITAKTDKSLKLAVNQLNGVLSGEVKSLRTELLEIMAQIEAGIDFPEHDIEEISRRDIEMKTRDILHRLKKMIDSAGTGKIFREGLRTVIVGKPNVGKSSLLNALLKENRAIVTDIPGTTRDVIEEVVSIKGIPLKIIDTAGIRETEDIVEKIGVEKTKEVFAEADLVLLVIDASTGITYDDQVLLPLVRGRNCIIIINKIDIKKDFDEGFLKDFVPEAHVIQMSLLNGIGLHELENKIEELVYKGLPAGQEEIMVNNIRHQNSLEKAAAGLQEALYGLRAQMPTDCMAIDIKAAWENLGEITGETVGEDLLDEIFSRFCIGK